MNFFDALILAPLIYGAWKGFQKGFLYELAMILGLIAGVYLGFKFSGLMYDLLKKLIGDQGQLLHYISFLVVLATIVLIFIFYARLMEAVLKITSLNMFNKVAGALFGVLKFALVLSVIFWLFKPIENSMPVIPEKARKESFLYPYMLRVASSLAPAVKDVKDEFRDKFGN